MNKKRMLITGVSGLLGNNLAYFLKKSYEVTGLYLRHPVTMEDVVTCKCDLTVKSNFEKALKKFMPDVVIHCASLTDVDRCEEDTDLSETLNHLCTKNMVDCLVDKDVKFVYISSDAVYDGEKGDFCEDDSVNPKNYYGISKYLGEWESRRKRDSLILRTNFFGWNIQDKESISEWILNGLKSFQKIDCFSDAIFSCIYTFDFAKILEKAISNNLCGVFNCGTHNSVSKFEFALKIADVFGFNRKYILQSSVKHHPFIAQRGLNLSMNIQKTENALNVMMPSIEDSIENCYVDYKSGLPEAIKQQNIVKKGSFIPYGKQYIDSEDIKSVIETLQSSNLTQGPKIKEFEDSLCHVTDAQFAVAVNSGTSALHIACLAAGIAPGDEVITSSNTFVASSNCVVYCNAKPVFADINPKTYNVSPEEIEKKISERTKAIIAVHFAGQSCDMEAIYNIVKMAEKKYRHTIFIIEDACHALGSRYKNKHVGSCVFSDMAVMSFHPAKHITTGEGGIVLTNDETLYKTLRRLRSHGITGDPKEFLYRDRAFQPLSVSNQTLMNPWYYEQLDLGYNYRITDIQCALGLSQIKKLHKFCNRRRKIVNRYNETFSSIESIQIPFESKDCDSNFHLYVLLLDFNKIGIERAQFMIELKRRGIQTQVHYIPVHSQPFYQRKFNTKWGDCPNAEHYYQKCLSIPLYPAMDSQNVERVIKEIKDMTDVLKAT